MDRCTDPILHQCVKFRELALGNTGRADVGVVSQGPVPMQKLFCVISPPAHLKLLFSPSLGRHESAM